MVPDDWGPRAPVVEEELDDDVMGAIRAAAWSGNRARDVAARLEEACGLAITTRGRGGGASARPGDHDARQGRRRECARGRAGAVAHVLTEDARAEEARERKERTVIRADTM